MSQGLIFKKICEVMKLVDAIGKDRQNEQQRYKFRGIDDVYNALHAKLAEVGVFSVPEVLEFTRTEKPTKTGGLMTYTVARIRYRFFAEDGSHFDSVVIGEGSDSGDKSANKSMAVAHKYALVQVFSIPTDEPDPDSESHEVAGPRQPAQNRPQNRQPARQAPRAAPNQPKPQAGTEAARAPLPEKTQAIIPPASPSAAEQQALDQARARRVIIEQAMRQSKHGWAPTDVSAVIQTKYKRGSAAEMSQDECNELVRVIYEMGPKAALSFGEPRPGDFGYNGPDLVL